MAGQTVWVRVAGRGTFQNSTGLKEFAAEMTQRGHRDFIVDLKDCELMDSTFMGTLAGVAIRLGPEGKLRVVRANERCRKVMKNLGLDRVVAVEEEPTGNEPPPPLRDAEGHPEPGGERAAVRE